MGGNMAFTNVLNLDKPNSTNYILNMIFHHTAKFKDIEHTFHGEVNFPNGKEKDIEANKELIIKGCKNQLVKDCERWGCEPKDMVFYEIYWIKRIFDDNGNGIEAKEMEVFRWER